MAAEGDWGRPEDPSPDHLAVDELVDELQGVVVVEVVEGLGPLPEAAGLAVPAPAWESRVLAILPGPSGQIQKILLDLLLLQIEMAAGALVAGEHPGGHLPEHLLQLPAEEVEMEVAVAGPLVVHLLHQLEDQNDPPSDIRSRSPWFHPVSGSVHHF